MVVKIKCGPFIQPTSTNTRQLSIHPMSRILRQRAAVSIEGALHADTHTHISNEKNYTKGSLFLSVI